MDIIPQDDPDFVAQEGSGESVVNNKYPSLDEFENEKVQEDEDELSPEEYSISRGELKSDSAKSYSGILYKNTFNVSTPILLVGVSFFGPSKELVPGETQQLCITLGVNESYLFQSNSKKCKKCRPKTDFLKVMKAPEKGKKFRVDFREPFPIRRNVWYNIEFEINDCATGQMERNKIQTNFVVKKSSGNKIARFNWLLGSCQMPDIHFIFLE